MIKTQNKFLKFLTIYSIVLQILTHKCVHEKMLRERIGAPIIQKAVIDEKNPKETNKEGRNLAEDDWHNMVIKVDYSNVSGVSQASKDFVQKTVMPMVMAKFATILKVKGSGVVKKFTACADDVKVPASYGQSDTKADLVVFAKILNEDQGYLAYAGPCVLENGTNRPVVGMVAINEKYMKVEPKQVIRLYETLLHEIAHILAVSPSLYDKFDTTASTFVEETRKSNTSSATVYKLVTPKLVAAAREHFGCSTISGVYLENEGDSGSAGAHFEKVHYGNELMTAQDVGIPALSKISLALFEDTNWYKPDYNLAEPLIWGKGKGCNFYNNNTCDTKFSEYCSTEQEMGCNDDYTVKTFCGKTDFSDDCFINDFSHNYVCSNKLGMAHTSHYSNQDSFETPGPFSRCFHTRLGENKRAGCFKSECNNGKIVLNVNNKVHTCDTTGQQITVGSITIICPDANDFCAKMNQSCNSDCNGNGRCLIGKSCYCDYFHTGTWCGNDKTCSGDTFCETLTTTAGQEEEKNTTTNTGTNDNSGDNTNKGDVVNVGEDNLDNIFDDVIDFFSYNPLDLIFGNLFLALITMYII